MQIRLQVRLSDTEVLEGPAIEQALPDAQRSAVRAMYYLAGTVWLEHEGQPSIEIRDDLEQLIPRLCIWSRRQLAAGEAVIVPMYISASTLTLTPMGKELKASASWEVEATYPLDDCIDQLRRCSHHYLRFLESNLSDDPRWSEKIDDVKMALRGMGELPQVPKPEPEGPDPHDVSEEEIKRILAEQASAS